MYMPPYSILLYLRFNLSIWIHCFRPLDKLSELQNTHNERVHSDSWTSSLSAHHSDQFRRGHKRRCVFVSRSGQSRRCKVRIGQQQLFLQSTTRRVWTLLQVIFKSFAVVPDSEVPHQSEQHLVHMALLWLKHIKQLFLMTLWLP